MTAHKREAMGAICHVYILTINNKNLNELENIYHVQTHLKQISFPLLFGKYYIYARILFLT